MHDTVKIEKSTLQGLRLIAEDYKVLKEEVENLYHTLESLELIREHELSCADEEVEEL